MHDLHLRCSGSLDWALSHLFQRGVLVPVAPGTVLAEFLLGSVGISPDDLEERVQTVFLDGRPVDDPAAATVGPGSAVALSASLPGLVGATMRKGGKYASLRSSITHRDVPREERGGGSGYATLRLFNLLVGDLGPDLLQRGVLVPASRLLGLLGSERNPGRCRGAEADHVPVDMDQLLERLRELEEEPVGLRMTTL